MKTFEYKGYDQGGKSARGLVEALDIGSAREKLGARGVLVEKMEPASGEVGRGLSRIRFAAAERDMFYHELATLLDAGLPLTRAFDVMIESPETEKLAPFIAGLRDRIKDGASLGSALASSSMGGSDFELAALDAGEQSGDLASVCTRLGDFQQRRNKVVQSLRTAMIYPAIVLGLCFILAVGMLGFMLSRFEQIWTEAGIELPLITKAVIAFGEWGVFVLPLLLILAVGGVFHFRSRMQASTEFRAKWHRRLFSLPVYSSIYVQLINLRFTGTLSLLLNGGVQLAEAISIAGRATGNTWVRGMVERESEQVRHGSDLSDAVGRVPPLAGALPGWIRAGEESGALVSMLESAQERFELKFEQSLQRSLRLVEPLVLLIVGGIVFVIALSILLPVLTVNQGI